MTGEKIGARNFGSSINFRQSPVSIVCYGYGCKRSKTNLPKEAYAASADTTNPFLAPPCQFLRILCHILCLGVFCMSHSSYSDKCTNFSDPSPSSVGLRGSTFIFNTDLCPSHLESRPWQRLLFELHRCSLPNELLWQ